LYCVTTRSDKYFTVLLAEDEVVVRNLLNRLLSMQGYEVLVGASGKEALELSRAFDGEIHLLLSDIQMPEMNGLDLAAALRKQRPQTEILLMSGRFSGELAILPSLNDFIRKPFLPKV
jgi:two-component system cell cycle sensor histidine kinase/response regulator CckA